jgi:hypothetical protein
MFTVVKLGVLKMWMAPWMLARLPPFPLLGSPMLTVAWPLRLLRVSGPWVANTSTVAGTVLPALVSISVVPFGMVSSTVKMVPPPPYFSCTEPVRAALNVTLLSSTGKPEIKMGRKPEIPKAPGKTSVGARSRASGLVSAEPSTTTLATLFPGSASTSINPLMCCRLPLLPILT